MAKKARRDLYRLYDAKHPKHPLNDASHPEHEIAVAAAEGARANDLYLILDNLEQQLRRVLAPYSGQMKGVPEKLWDALDAARYLRRVHQKIKKDDAYGAALMTLRMTQCVHRLQLRRAIGSANGRRSAKKTRVESAADRAEYWQELADEIWEKHPRWSRREVAAQISRMLTEDDEDVHVSFETIRRKIKRRG